MTECEHLANSARGYVIAPAGHGKTHLICAAAACATRGRQLILTHTHAGVSALRSLLHKMGVESKRVRVDTIDGWSLEYARAFPGLAKIEQQSLVEPHWPAVHEATARLLKRSALLEVLRASYSGVYVDEYQDCSPGQHKIVLALAEVLPCRVLGDPLQGIFDFDGAGIIDWSRDVAQNFEPLPELAVPHRWRQPGANRDLGDWLLSIRPRLEAGQPIELEQSPRGLYWIKVDDSNKQVAGWKVCMDLSKEAQAGRSVVAIQQWPRQCHELARKLKGVFKVVEPVEVKELYTAARIIESTAGAARIESLAQFAKKCISGLSSSSVGTVIGVVVKGKKPKRHSYREQGLLDALTFANSTDELNAVRLALEAFSRVEGARVFRPDLFRSLSSALQMLENGRSATLSEAAREVRSLARHAGRRFPSLTVGRTLLIKGLQFDHTVIFDADTLDSKNLYVALSRASRTVTVLSSTPVLGLSTPGEKSTPRKAKNRRKQGNGVKQLPLFES